MALNTFKVGISHTICWDNWLIRSDFFFSPFPNLAYMCTLPCLFSSVNYTKTDKKISYQMLVFHVYLAFPRTIPGTKWGP